MSPRCLPHVSLLAAAGALLLLTGLGCGDSSGTAPADTPSDVSTDAPADAQTSTDDSGDTSAPDPDAEPIDTASDATTGPGTGSDPINLTSPVPTGEVRAGVITDPAALFPGWKADGQVGDVKLYNAHVGFIVEGARLADGFRYFGGHPVDAVVYDDAGIPSEDLYGEAFFGWNLGTFEPEQIEVVDPGTSGTAHVRMTGGLAPLLLAEGLLQVILNVEAPDLEVTFDYRLGPDDDALEIAISLANSTPLSVYVDYPMVVAVHGDGVFAWASPAGLDASEAIGLEVDAFSVVGRDIGYGLVADGTDILLFGTYEGLSLATLPELVIEPGGTSEQRWWLAARDNGAAGLHHTVARLRGEAEDHVELAGAVTLPPTAAPDAAWVGVFDATDGSSLGAVTMAPVASDGTFHAQLPPGAYRLQAYLPDHAPSLPVDVTLGPDGDSSTALEIPAAATVHVSVTESGTGTALTSRVSFLREGATPSPAPPESMRLHATWRDPMSAVAFAVHGEATVQLPPGDYRAVASRGFSFELDDQPLTADVDAPTALDLELVRAVDTTGWISADFHVHAIGSMDSFVPYDIRALQAATDDLDLPVLTEHDYLADGAPGAAKAGVADRVLPLIAQEVTTLAYGHFGAFPLVLDPDAPNQGAIFPHDKDPHELFAAIRDQHPHDELIQINHPRTIAAGGYFSYVGLDAAADTTSNPDEWSLNWDTVEVYSRDCGPDTNDNAKTRDDWIGLTNHGHRKVLSSGSDNHDLHEFPGVPRNWIQLDADTVRADPQALVQGVRARRMFVSCGPFVRFETLDGVGLGGLASVDSAGGVDFVAVVEAPTWIQIDEVRLLENGHPIDVIDVTAPADPVVRLDTILRVEPTADAWYALEVLGSGSLQPVNRSGPPNALTNPIEVDADGDGDWTPPGS